MKTETNTSVRDRSAEQFNQKKPRQLMELLNEADERITRTGGLTHDEFWRAVEADTAKPQKSPKAARRSR